MAVDIKYITTKSNLSIVSFSLSQTYKLWARKRNVIIDSY